MNKGGMRTRVNWSAWGAQDLQTTEHVAECLLAAIELGRAFEAGFSFVSEFIDRSSVVE